MLKYQELSTVAIDLYMFMKQLRYRTLCNIIEPDFITQYFLEICLTRQACPIPIFSQPW